MLRWSIQWRVNAKPIATASETTKRPGRSLVRGDGQCVAVAVVASTSSMWMTALSQISTAFPLKDQG
jgi:hypothetical protein